MESARESRKMDKESLKTWLVPLLEKEHCSLYDVEWDTSMKPPVLRISVENNDGPTDLDVCAKCSDLISARLDEDDSLNQEYMLEVCSPGAERELKSDEAIAKAKGEYVYVKLKKGQNGLQDVTGTMSDVKDDAVVISYFVKGRPKKVEIPKDNIAMIMTTVKV